jgi:hypothetical protein
MTKYPTISSLFLVPIATGMTCKSLGGFGFVEAYSDDIAKPRNFGSNKLYLLFKKNREFKRILSTLSEKNNFVDCYSKSPDKEVIVLSLPKEYRNDYEKIKEGKYSELSKEFMSFFPKHVTYVSIDPRTNRPVNKRVKSIQFMIYERDGQLKQYWEQKIGIEIAQNAELWSKFDIEKETMNSDALNIDSLVSEEKQLV